MPATDTLLTLVLIESVDASSTWIRVASTTGLSIPTAEGQVRPTGGIRIFVDGECMDALKIGPGGMVQVLRGVDGTAARPHSSGALIYFGRPDQFYSYDPIGAPPEAIAVSPWINVINGTVWYAQGDSEPNGLTQRWWQKQTSTPGFGALGIRTTTLNPESST